MLMKSRDGEAKRVTSTTGHIMIVGDKPIDIPDFMEVDAYQAGCIACESDGEQELEEDSEESLMRRQLVYENMKLMLDRNGKTDITANGAPNKYTLGKLCGVHHVRTDDFEWAWNKILIENDGE